MSTENIHNEIELLIAGYLTGSLNQEELLRLKTWLEQDNQNKKVFEELTASWLLANHAYGTNHHRSDQQWNDLKKKIKTSHPGTTRKVWITIGVAASCMIFFFIGSLFTRYSEKQGSPISRNTEISAPLGSKSIIKLPDGTTVWLNAGSKLIYNQDFGKKDRHVNLSGEAYFSVASNKAKPFLVKTSDLVIRALGTRFNVKAYPEEKTITATLEEGQIDVQMISGESKKKILLKPNEKAVFHKNSLDFESGKNEIRSAGECVSKKIETQGKKLEVAENVNTGLYTSWKDNRWIIEALPLASLAPMLERRYNMKIMFSNEEVKQFKFSGTIENETIEQLLSAMRFTAPIDYKIRKDTISLMLNTKLNERFLHIIKNKK